MKVQSPAGRLATGATATATLERQVAMLEVTCDSQAEATVALQLSLEKTGGKEPPEQLVAP